jgi:hypothetical protein
LAFTLKHPEVNIANSDIRFDISKKLATKKLATYRVSEGKVVFLIGLWQKEIYKLDDI